MYSSLKTPHVTERNTRLDLMGVVPKPSSMKKRIRVQREAVLYRQGFSQGSREGDLPDGEALRMQRSLTNLVSNANRQAESISMFSKMNPNRNFAASINKYQHALAAPNPEINHQATLYHMHQPAPSHTTTSLKNNRLDAPPLPAIEYQEPVGVGGGSYIDDYGVD
jgi:hypothetical protein